MRPRKYNKARYLLICIDDKDLSFLDDHRDKMTRGDFLVESMYALKNETSSHLKELTEKYKQLSQENQELKKELMFLHSKSKKQPKPEIPEITVYSDEELVKWYNEKNMTELINNMGRSINWQNLFDKNIQFFSLILKDHKELEKFCMEKYKNNGFEKK